MWEISKYHVNADMKPCQHCECHTWLSQGTSNSEPAWVWESQTGITLGIPENTKTSPEVSPRTWGTLTSNFKNNNQQAVKYNREHKETK